MPAATAIPAVLGAAGVGGSIFGAVKGANAAHDAATIQAEAAKQIADLAQTTAGTAGANVQGRGDQAAVDVNNATGDAINRVLDAVKASNAGQQPFLEGGTNAFKTLSDALAPGGDLTKTFTADDMAQYDPGYDFRLKQGQLALDRSAAARGGAMGGGQLKAIADFSQNLASSEYQNAFNRFRTQQQDRFNMLKDTAGFGERAATTTGATTMRGGEDVANLGVAGTEAANRFQLQGATTAGDYAMQGVRTAGDALSSGAAARAAGEVGAANAVNNGVSNAFKAGLGAYGMYKLGKR